MRALTPDFGTSQDCRAELAGCLADATCAESLLCLQTCAGRPDESDCQVKCGDQFNDAAVQRFNTCAVSEEKCVPQRDDGTSVYPIPSPDNLASDFPTDKFVGDWWITAGQNTLFDTFDCQRHTFSSPAPGAVSGDIRWRVRDEVQEKLGRKGAFFSNEVTQDFVQVPGKPWLLENHDNEYLHYQDDWYVVDYSIEDSEDDFVLIYYRGKNDAWEGYGGATVYTRKNEFPEALRKRVTDDLKPLGYDFRRDFVITDNTCKAQPPPLAEVVAENIEESLEETVENVEIVARDPKRLRYVRPDSVLPTSTLRALAKFANEVDIEKENIAETVSEYNVEARGGYLKADAFLNIDQLRALSQFSEKVSALFGR